jgi:hypothetical protein
MVVSSAGLKPKPKSDCTGKAQKQFCSKLQTRHLVREGAIKLQTRNCLEENFKEKVKLVAGPRWPTVGRNVTSTWVWNDKVCLYFEFTY